MQQIYLGIGTNQGNKLANLDKALFYITQLVGQITNVSAVYKTDPWGFLEQPFFYNMVIKVIGNLDYETCLEKILDIEKIIGRKEEFKYGPRIIDIDLLFFNNLVINKPLIQIPHPQIPHRKFVLKPLSEIAPLLIHPINNTPIITLLKNCSDNGLVRKLNDNSLKKYIN